MQCKDKTKKVTHYICLANAY